MLVELAEVVGDGFYLQCDIDGPVHVTRRELLRGFLFTVSTSDLNAAMRHFTRSELDPGGSPLLRPCVSGMYHPEA